MGETEEGYTYERVGGVLASSNFSIIRTDPNTGRGQFQLYGVQRAQMPEEIELRLGELRQSIGTEWRHVTEPVSVVEFGGG